MFVTSVDHCAGSLVELLLVDHRADGTKQRKFLGFFHFGLGFGVNNCSFFCVFDFCLLLVDGGDEVVEVLLLIFAQLALLSLPILQDGIGLGTQFVEFGIKCYE